VLLVGSDRRFRSVTAALLQRRGYEVTIGEHVASMADVAAREHVDVVVLDAGTSPAVAALEAARLEALNPPVGMVLVCDDSIRELPTAQVVQKWGSFDGLHDAIELVRAGRQSSRLG
jgi:DNA-binding response OmpR family regulator